jgi:hypothetical protein
MNERHDRAREAISSQWKFNRLSRLRDLERRLMALLREVRHELDGEETTVRLPLLPPGTIQRKF